MTVCKNDNKIDSDFDTSKTFEVMGGSTGQSEQLSCLKLALIEKM
jgi:hypothetical protein